MLTIGERTITIRDYQRLINRIGADIGRKSVACRWLHRLYLLLQGAIKVKSEEVSDDVITMHSDVEIRYLSTNLKKRVRLIYPGDRKLLTDNGNEHVTVYEPLGMALLGMKEHDIFVTDNNTNNPVRVEKILFQPEAHRLFNL